MLQIIFECGFIDPSKYDHPKIRKQYYTTNGKNDGFGNLIEDLSLQRIMERQPDFLDKETLLQYHGRRIGIEIDHSSVAHSEVAGEGLEYGWGVSKHVY